MQQRLDSISTPMLTAEHPGAVALNAALAGVIESERARDPVGINRSNVGRWHPETDMLRLGMDMWANINLAGPWRVPGGALTW